MLIFSEASICMPITTHVIVGDPRSNVKVVNQLEIHKQKHVFTFWFNTRENALILLM